MEASTLNMQQDEPEDFRRVIEETIDTLPRCVASWEMELPEVPTSLAISPKGKLVAVATVEDEITLVDAASGTTSGTLPGHKGGTNHVAFFSGVALASCGEDGKARIWNLAHKTCLAELEVDGTGADRTGSGASVAHLSVTPGLASFAVASGKTVAIFRVSGDSASLSSPQRSDLPDLPSVVESLKFDADGNLLAAYKGGVTVWNLSTKSEEDANALDLPYDGPCLSVDAIFSKGWVVAGCHEAVVHIWRVIHKQEGEEEEEEGIELEQLTMSGYEKRVSMADFDRLERRYLATCGGAQLIVWDFAETPQGSVPTVGVGHRKMITCQSWQNEEPGLLATGSKDGTVLFYDVTDIAVPGAPNLCLPGVAAPLPGDRDDEATALIWGPDGKVFVGHVSGTLRAWNLPLNP